MAEMTIVSQSSQSTAQPPRSRPHHLEAAERLAAPRAGVDIFRTTELVNGRKITQNSAGEQH